MERGVPKMISRKRNSGRNQRMPTNRLHGCQARAARAMLMWSVRQLASQSGISESSIRRIESGFGIPENVTLDLLTRLREFYEGKGFTFTFEPDPGVTWRRKERRTGDRRGSSGGGLLESAAIVTEVAAVIPWVFGDEKRTGIANRSANRSFRSRSVSR